MNIDQRLEALTTNVELLAPESAKQDRQIAEMSQGINTLKIIADRAARATIESLDCAAAAAAWWPGVTDWQILAGNKIFPMHSDEAAGLPPNAVRVKDPTQIGEFAAR